MDVNQRVVNLACSYEKCVKHKYVKKLKWLLRYQNVKPRFSNNDFITAWDNITPPKCLLEALKYGPLFAPAPLPTPEFIVPNIETIIKELNITSQEYVRWETRFSTAKERSADIKSRQFHNCIKNAREWLHKNDVVLIKADKSKRVVLIKRNSYNQKLQEYIRDTECKPAPDKYLESLQQRVKKFSSTPLARYLRMHNSVVQAPRTPRIFAFGKTHKPDCHIHPVIEKCGSPTFAIEKQLVKFIRPRIQDYPYAINNSVQLVDKLRNINLEDNKVMTVMDFKSLFPSIKLPPCFCELRNFLLTNINNATKYHQHILELAHLICYTSFFAFEGNTYLQERGVPMGSPISPLLCELVLRRLESNVLSVFINDILVYARYVDDVFNIWRNDNSAQYFLNKMNNNPYGVTLSLEQKSDTNVNFLDLSITCKYGEIWTHIYRKPSYLPIIIPKNSFDPHNFKNAAFRSWIKQAYTHCTSIVDTHRELNNIRTIAVQQGYRISEINALIDKFCNQTNKQPITKSQGPRVVLNYIPFLQSMIKKVYHKNILRVIYRRNPTIYRILRNDKKKGNRNNSTGVT
ncbi:uncharacterized protein LOC111612376 [Centruroides sculpturatus]|uniref:uncharacterized protein LOC111612376 n=1 Tax=Centruroides sculpturatus TaxID=218467 RepID=UPI000C6DBD8B|nr:uncharacterized protein LOC111612376 [Centruroides sculpturatus]